MPLLRRRLSVLLAGTCLVAAPAKAADWLGTVSSDWSVAGNWNPAAVPGSSTDVTINSGPANPAAINAPGALARTVDIGTNAGQSGTLTVNGGTLTIATAPDPGLAVGNFGTGTLTVSGGGIVNGGRAYVALNPGSTGTVTVTGSGSQLNTSILYIGDDVGANGQATIQNGAALTSGTTVLGFFHAAANGTLTVTGATASTGSLTVGERGAGTFTLNGGSTATSGFVAIGSSNATGNGTVNVSGSGTTWTTGNMNVGTIGTGALTISNGATVTSNRTFGPIPVSSIGGSVTVTGAGSQWSIDGSQLGAQATLGIGSKVGATGSLTVSSGGQVTIRNNATGTSGENSDTRLGIAAGSTGTLTVTGAGSSFTTPYNLHVGYNTTGNVTVSNGGALNTGAAQIASNPGGSGGVTVTGAGSVWNLTDTQNAATQLSSGVTIGNAGVGALTIAAGGAVNVNTTLRQVQLGGSATGNGTLNIGAAAADPAAAPGTLNADVVVFSSAGTSRVVNFNHTSGNYVFAPRIAGSNGTVNFLAGTTIMTGDSNYTGTTTIATGATVQLGNGGPTGMITSNITNNGALIFDRSLFPTYGGVISGSGSVEQRGPDTLTLTGNNTYTGLTTISNGTLQIGANGTTGSIAGNVLNNSEIVFSRSNNFSYNGVISGSGSFVKSGAGIMTLGGANTFTGGTSVQRGTLRLGGDDRLAATGSLFLFANGTFDLAGFSQTVGDLSGPGTVAIGTGSFTAGTAADSTFAGRFTGTGAFTKQSSGTLNLTGNSAAYTGTTTVAAGTLLVNGDLSGSPVSVNAGATLGGNGAVGPTVVNGNIAPGNSIGLLTVNGNYTQAAGSTYTVEVDATPAADRINVTGAASIQGGTVNVLAVPGLYTVGQRYTILNALGGVTGTYAALTDNAPFIDFALAYDPFNVYLDVIRSGISFQQIAQTPNQRAAASGVEGLGAGNRVFDAVTGLDAANALRAFDLLSGEIHATVMRTLIEDSRLPRDATLARLRQIGDGPDLASQIAVAELSDPAGANPLAYAAAPRQPHPLAAPAAARGPALATWAQAFGNTARADGDGNAAALSQRSGGIIAGFDVTTPGRAAWRFGMAAGYQHTALDVADRASSAGIDAYHLAAYGGVQDGPLGLRFGAAYSWHDISTTRTITFPGFADVTKADYHGSVAQVFGEAAYRMATGPGALEPYARLVHAHARSGALLEAGGAAALAGGGSRFDATFSTLGMRAAVPVALAGDLALTFKATLGWQHAFADTPTATLAFASGGPAFTVAGVPLARDLAITEAGLEVRLGSRVTAGLFYQGQYAGHARDHALTGRLTVHF